MRKPSDSRFRAAAALALLWSLGGCAPGDDTPPRRQPLAGASTGPVGTPTAGVAAAPPVGSAGYSAPAGSSGGYPVSGTGSISQPPAGAAGSGDVAGTPAPPPPPPGPPPPFDAGSDPNRNKVMAGGICARLAVIDCAAELHCCNNPGRTVEACKSDIMTTCTNSLYLDEISRSVLTAFNPAAAESAFTTLEQKASTCDPTVASWGGSPDGLRGILKGTIAPGGDCHPKDERGDDLLVPTPEVAAPYLAACTMFATHACVFTSAIGGDWTCEARGGSGGTCVTDNNCLDGFFCSNPQLVGKCAPQLEVGATCSIPTQCRSLFCKGGKCVVADQQAAYCLQN